jgi:hypothetical protein
VEKKLGTKFTKVLSTFDNLAGEPYCNNYEEVYILQLRHPYIRSNGIIIVIRLESISPVLAFAKLRTSIMVGVI